MGALFSRKKPQQQSRVTEADKAILQLKQQRDKLKQYQKKILLNLEKERLVAKQLLQEGKKDKAKLLLRKKKFQEGLIQKTDSQLESIEQLVHDLEFAQIESKVLEGLKYGNESLKKMQQLMSLEEVERIMEETSEAVEYQRQISDLLSGGLSEQDESEVMDELNSLLALESEAVEVNLPDVPAEGQDVSLPDVPTTDLPKPEKVKKQPIRQEVLAA